MPKELEDGTNSAGVAAAAFERLELIGHSPAFRDALRLIERIAAVDATVLVQGETGTGKELATRAIHYLSRRRHDPFVPVNCAALPDNLLESELFGHERGAFTDAKQARRGLVAQAEGGTLYLDEVEAMSPRAQGVLLRFLQDHSYRPVGGQRLARGDLRIVASSNVDLQALAARGQFRQDLLFRLGVLSVTMPPLRRRGDDARLLAEHFVRRFARQHGRPEKRLHPDCAAWMARHPWPGNVRELENLMLRELLLGDGDSIRVGDEDPAAAEAGPEVDLDQAFQPAKARAISVFERHYLSRLLARAGGNISLAARLSRKDRSALNKLVKKHGLGGVQRETAAGP
ncbi:MAG: sigma-54 dependent transcriptional regulator [Dongiaceae bacterium]